MKLKIKILLFILFIISIILILFSQITDENFVTINNTKIEVEIVDTVEKQMRGLSGRESLDDNRGMLFIFSGYKIKSFWMKDMLFPIDIIWIAGNKIIGIVKNAPIPDGENIAQYYSPRPINLVLEINAGFSDQNNIKVGDRVDFSL